MENKKLIYLDDARRAILHNDPAMVHCIDNVPIVDAVEVVHAKWITKPGVFDWFCSNCDGELLYEVQTYGGGNYHDINTVWSSFCPHCGAKMDLED